MAQVLIKKPKKYTCYGVLVPVWKVVAAAAIWSSVRLIRMIRNRQSTSEPSVMQGFFNFAALPSELYVYLEDWLIEVMDDHANGYWIFDLYCRCSPTLRAWSSREGDTLARNYLKQQGLPTKLLRRPFEGGTYFLTTSHPTISRIRAHMHSQPGFQDVIKKHTSIPGDLDTCPVTWDNLWDRLSFYSSVPSLESYLWENLIDTFLYEHGLSNINVLGVNRSAPDGNPSSNLVAIGITTHLPLADGLFLRTDYVVEKHLETSTLPSHVAHIGRHLNRFLVLPNRASWIVFHQPGFNKELMATAWALCCRLCQRNDEIA